MSVSAALSQAFTLPNGSVVKNRLFKSAMSEALGRPDGSASPELVRLYGTWADGGVGLCVTGNVMIDRHALGEPGNVVVEGDEHLSALQAWAQAATRHGTRCWVQLNHPGKQAPKGLNAETVAPSAIPFRSDLRAFFATPRALSSAEVHALVARFARAAAVCQRAGFSGVQIHGAHGYLVSQFLSPHHNRRTDEWGGTAVKRRAFVLAVYRAMREAVGPDFPIGIKLNSADFQRGGFTEAESLDTLRALADAGIDLIEISGGTYEAPAMTGVGGEPGPVRRSTQQREAYFMAFADRARQAVRVPLVVTGGFRSAQGMADALRSGAVDFVGIARIMAIEPGVCLRLLKGQDPLHAVRPRKTGIGPIDRWGLLEITWYTGQLQRIGKGKAPKPAASPLWVFIKFVAAQARLGRRRPPLTLRAAP